MFERKLSHNFEPGLRTGLSFSRGPEKKFDDLLVVCNFRGSSVKYLLPLCQNYSPIRETKCFACVLLYQEKGNSRLAHFCQLFENLICHYRRKRSRGFIQNEHEGFSH